MAFWFEKNEKRRFPRVNMPMQVFIRPCSPSQDKQIIAYAANYQPTSLLKKREQIKVELQTSMSAILEQKEVLKPVFDECINLADLFGKTVQTISKGKNPAQNREELLLLEKLTSGFVKIESLKKEGPKTHQFFEMMNEKFIAYSKGLIKVLQKSNNRKFYIYPDLETTFKMDQVIPKFKAEKYKHIPLSRALYLLSELINLHLATFIELLKEHTTMPPQSNWTLYDIGISACGLDIKLPKDYPLNTRLNIELFFPETKKSISLKGVLLRSEADNQLEKQKNCINFEFPNYHEQQFIENQQQAYQINRCITDD